MNLHTICDCFLKHRVKVTSCSVTSLEHAVTETAKRWPRSSVIFCYTCGYFTHTYNSWFTQISLHDRAFSGSSLRSNIPVTGWHLHDIWLPCASHCSKQFTSMNTLSLRNNLLGRVSLTSFQNWGNWGQSCQVADQSCDLKPVLIRIHEVYHCCKLCLWTLWGQKIYILEASQLTSSQSFFSLILWFLFSLSWSYNKDS